MSPRYLRILFVAAAALAAIAALAPVWGSPDEHTPVTPSPSVTSMMAAPSPPPGVATATEIPTPNLGTIDADEPGPDIGFGTPASALTPPWSSPPVADSEGMALAVTLWLDASTVGGEVVAFVNGIECGRSHTLNVLDGGPFTSIGVESDAVRHGCGVRGAIVAFTINGRVADTTVEWQPGLRPHIDVIVGPAFASYYGTLRLDPGWAPPMHIAPYVGDTRCDGQSHEGIFWSDTRWDYSGIILPDELRPGCGRDGVDVVFHLEVAGQDDIILTTIPWDTGHLTHFPDFDLTGKVPMGPYPWITPGP